MFFYYYYFLYFSYVSCIFYFYYYFYYFSCFLSFNLKSAQYSSYSGCLARDEFLVIREGYHMLFYIFAFFCCSALHQLEWAISGRELIRINFRITFQNHLRSQNSVWQITSAKGLKMKKWRLPQFKLRARILFYQKKKSIERFKNYSLIC